MIIHSLVDHHASISEPWRKEEPEKAREQRRRSCSCLPEKDRLCPVLLPWSSRRQPAPISPATSSQSRQPNPESLFSVPQIQATSHHRDFVHTVCLSTCPLWSVHTHTHTPLPLSLKDRLNRKMLHQMLVGEGKKQNLVSPCSNSSIPTPWKPAY
jgi:hypothetical protein